MGGRRLTDLFFRANRFDEQPHLAPTLAKSSPPTYKGVNPDPAYFAANGRGLQAQHIVSA